MLSRQRLLKLSLIVGLLGSGGLLGFLAKTPQAGNTKGIGSTMPPAVVSSASAQTPQTSYTKDINALMVERRDVLSKRVDALKIRFEGGQMQADGFYRAKNELLSAEFELATTREDRLAALKSQLANYQSLEKRALDLQVVGAKDGQVEHVLSATADRLLAEIQVLRELATGN